MRLTGRNSNVCWNFGKMSKKVTYEIDFTGRDSASGVASKIVSAVVAGQKEASSSIRRVSAELQSQGDAASSAAARSKAVLDSVAGGAGGVASGIRAVADEAASSIGRLSAQASGISELRAEVERLQRAKTEAYAAGDNGKAYDIEGQIRQLGYQINRMKSVKAELEEQRKAAESLSSTYTRTYDEVCRSLSSGEGDLSSYTQLIENQKKVVADLSARYQQLKAARASSSETSALLSELNEEKGALSGMRDAVAGYRQSNATLETQVMRVREEMGRLLLAGKENTAEYERLRQELERLGTAYREVQAEQKSLSSGAAQIGGVISGIQGLMGAYSAGSGIVSMFVRDSEKLMAVQTKMQSVMAVMMGVQQVSNTLHATSAFRVVTCRRATELWTAAQNRLTAALRLSSAASKAMLATMTMGASLIATGVIAAISKLVSKYREKTEAQKEARKAEEETMKSVRSSVAGSVASQLVAYRKLQKAWNDLSGNIAKQKKFVTDNAEEFRKLGVRVNSVRDAENVLVSGESAFVESLKRRAMAAAAMELASKKYQSAVENMLKAEDAGKVTDDDRKKARTYAEGVYQSRLSSADGVLGRGQVSGRKRQIVGAAYASNVGTYGEARAKEYGDAAKKEMAEGDRYFGIVKEYNEEADRLLNGGGMSPSGDGGSLGGKAGSIDAIEKKIQSLTAQMKSAGASERAELQKDINAWRKKLEAVNLELEALSVPSDPQTIQELDTAITYYGKLLKVAGASERAEIQKTINGYTKKKTAIESSLKALSVTADPKTFEEYSTVISALEDQLKQAAQSEQAGIQATINAYRREEEELKARVALASAPAVLNSLADYEQAISACESALRFANDEERANIQRTINEYRKKKEAIEESLEALDIPADPKTLEDIGKVISSLEAKLMKASVSEAAEINREIALWNEKADAIRNARKEAVKTAESAGDALKSSWSGAKQIGSGIDGITEALEGNGSAWSKLTAIVDGFLGICDGIKAVVGVIQTLTLATQAHTAAKGAESAAVAAEAATEVAAGAQKIATNSAVSASNTALATTNTLAAGSGAAAAVASIPYVGPILAIAAIASVIGAILAIPKFADGGIASGKTLAMVGEYAGAANNPEVIAPLDKLKSLLGAEEGGGRREIEFRIRGKDLVGVERRENNRRRRS